jgi:hypothetical protein
VLTNNEGRSFGYFELHREFYSISLLRVPTDIFRMSCCHLDIMWVVWRVCTLWLNLARNCFILVRPFGILTCCYFVFNIQHYWKSWSDVKSRWVRIIWKLPCRYGKEFSERWGRWGFMLIRLYLRHVCTEGPVLNKWISDSFKNLAISTYWIKSYRLTAMSKCKNDRKFRRLTLSPFS